MAGNDPGHCLHEPSARQLPRRLWRRPDLRRAGLLHDGMADWCSARTCGRDHPGGVRPAAAKRTAADGNSVDHLANQNGAERPRRSAIAMRPYLIFDSRNSTCLRATGSYFFLTILSVMVREFFLAT